jgi:hypothetical protein
VPGGGAALLHAAKELTAVKDKLDNFDQKIGVQIIANALKVGGGCGFMGGRAAASARGWWQGGALGLAPASRDPSAVEARPPRATPNPDP